MSKPKWLESNERKRMFEDNVRRCRDCANLGTPVRKTKGNRAGSKMVYECDVHPGCYNTPDAYACSEWTSVRA